MSDSICTMPLHQTSPFRALVVYPLLLQSFFFAQWPTHTSSILHLGFFDAFYPAAMFRLCTIPQAKCFHFVFLMHPSWLHLSIVISQDRA